MASNAPNTCEICDLKFNEDDRCPRMLHCLHCLCHSCVEQLITRNQKTCPFCRKTFEANSAKDVGVNRYLLDLLKYVEEMEKSYRSPVKENRIPFASMAKEYREDYQEDNRINISECLNNKSDIENKLKRNTGMYGELSQLKKHLKTDVSFTINKVETKIDGLMMRIETEDVVLQIKLREVTDQEKRLRSLDDKLLSVSSSVKDDVALMEETEKANVKMKQLLRDWKDFLTKQEKLQDNIKKVTEKTANQISRIEELLNSEEEEAEQEIELLASSEIFTIDAFRSMDEPLRKMIQDDRVFAVQHFEGNQRYARITHSQEDGRLCLHHLQEVQHLPPNVTLIPFGKVMNVDDSSSSSRIAFLELGDGKRSLGKIFIKLINHSNYSLNFSYLCTGQKGPSYVNSCLMEVYHKRKDHEWVLMGDYEKNKEIVGKAVVPGVDWNEEYYRDIHKTSFIEKGLVKAFYYPFDASKASQFFIFTSDRHTNKDGIFGIVDKGLDVLSEAIKKYPNIEEVKIIDSGIVLSQ